MPWFKIDDSAHSHPKFVRAGNAALGLWLRCGSYSAQHLLEGFIPKDIVKPFKGTPAQVRKLIDAGLWHEAGHDCKNCPQPADGYMIHDFFEGGRNTTRAQHEANKKAAADRAAKSRASRKRTGNESESNNIHDTNGAGNFPNPVRNEPYFSGSSAGQEGLSHRTPADGVTPAQATAMPSQVLPTEEPPPYPPHAGDHLPAVYGGGQAAAAVGPDWLQPLTAAMGTAGMHVPWKFKGDDLTRLHNDILRLGIPVMVKQASRSWQSARTPVVSSRFFYDSWHALPTPQHTDGRPSLHSVDGPSKTSEYLEDMAAIADELRAGGMK